MTFQPAEGKLLQDRYLLKEELGRGAMGTVVLAEDIHLQREVAIKVLFNQGTDEAGRQLLLDEARSIAKLNHPNIVAIYDASEDDGTPFIVMERIHGQSLREKELLSLEEIITAAMDIVRALEHAHQQDIIHRDLKPENVLISQSGQTKLMDFGLARDMRATHLSEDGRLSGTIAYLAPELILGQPASQQSDYYALGVMLYEAAAGKLPFEAENPAVLLTNHLHAPVVPPSLHNPQIPLALDDIILNLLEKDPRNRPASAAEILEALQIILRSDQGDIQLDVQIPETALLSRIARGRLIGREKELGEATGLWLQALSGQAGMLLISGEPGIGKTRFAQAINDQSRVGGALVLRGGCYEFEAATPYLPFTEAIQNWFSDRDDEEIRSSMGSSAAELSRLVPEIESRLGPLPAGPPLGPEEERRRLFEAITRFLSTLARERGLLLFVDDLHWADHGTIAAISYLMRRMRDSKFLLIGAYREVELDRSHPLASALVQWNRQRVATRIQLSRFSVDETNKMIATLFGQEKVSDQFAQLVHQETEGNPFFIEEVMKSLVEAGQIYWSGDHWERDELEELAIPQSIKEAIGRRLNRLSEICVDVLHFAAVIGKDFPYALLQSVAMEDEEVLLDALEEAVESQLIAQSGADKFVFTHDKIREVLYEEILSIRRRRLHRQIATALEASSIKSSVEDLAYHFISAGVMDKGMAYALKAAEKSNRIFANDEALGYYQQALECAITLEDVRAQASIYELMGDIYAETGPFKDAIDNYEKAILLTESPEDKAALQVRMGLVYTITNDEEAIPIFEEALDKLDSSEQPIVVARALTGLGRFKHYRCQYSAAIELFQQARVLAEAQEDSLTLFYVNAYLAGAYQHLALFDESMAWAEKGIKLGEKHNDLHMVAIGYEFFSENWTIMGYWNRAIEDAERNLQIGRKIGSNDRVCWATWNIGFNLVGKGDLARGMERIQEALALATLIGEKRLSVFGLASLGFGNVDSGNDQAALDFIEQAIDSSRQMVEIYLQGYTTQMKGYINLQLGRYEEAVEAYRLASELTEDTEVRDIEIISLPYNAEAELYLGHIDVAISLVEEALALTQETGALHYEAVSHRVMGQVMTTQKDYDKAAASFENAAKMAEVTDSWLELGRIYYQQALMQLESSHREQTPQYAARAVDRFTQCAAMRDLKKANKILNH